MTTKTYYLPRPRASLEPCSDIDLVTKCMNELGVSDPWNVVLAYLHTMPPHAVPSVEMVAVDCLEPAQSRVKVYFRYHDNNLDTIIQHSTLGGTVDDLISQNTTSSLRELWGFLFPGVRSYEGLPLPNPSRPPGPGFLIYHEMRLGSSSLDSKVYIPVRQYCPHDAQIAQAISQYMKSTGVNAAERYAEDLQNTLYVAFDIIIVSGFG